MVGEVFSPAGQNLIWAPDAGQAEVGRIAVQFRSVLKKQGLSTSTTAEWDPQRCNIIFRLSPELVPQQDGYRISVTDKRLSVYAHDAPGLRYAVLTLGQILEQIPAGQPIPCMKISDWPDFPNRGVMLDVSRDKIPTMETLYQYVDYFASWKINQLQLYTEHSFAYKGHEVVWKDASPMTPEQVRALDAYCRERFIELVPNQNTFGHMERWLKHEPYRQFAEAPDGFQTGSGWQFPRALCVTDPRSIALVDDLLGQLIPHFTSGQVNVGCDETHDLGRGRSRELVEERGFGRVYLDFLLKIHAVCEKHGKVMQFWGDIIRHYPELIPELPDNVIAMVWGYRPEHPYGEECRKYKASGVPFYVCPGTSAWLSLSGRTQRAFDNIRNAVTHGLEHGAIGVLNTSWCARGAWQSYASPFPGFVYGAGLSWCVESNLDADVPSLLDRYVFFDEAGVIGKVVCEVGNAYAVPEGYYNGDTSYLAKIMLDPELPMTINHFKWLTPEKVTRIREHVQQSMRPLGKARLPGDDGGLVIEEIRHSAELVLFACDLFDARLAAEGNEMAKVPEAERQRLAGKLRSLLASHEKLWLQRNRVGGLADSKERMTPLLNLLENK
ncbi:family 20 glycosylhydrolase [Verrucomicrobiaceae bacterium E54]|nr:family 20 glycosylhydrolase [Verrucomicrobiaceae bacterium E54]